MVWKVERWQSDIFPGYEKLFEEYRFLTGRELAIVSAAVLDAAVAETLTMRLRNYEKECEDFLGLNGDGRAPVGSFGARIQLALLVGILTPNDAAILKAVKDLRNLFAHRVNLTFLSPTVLNVTVKLHGLLMAQTEKLIQNGHLVGSTESFAAYVKILPTEEEAGAGLVLAVMATYQAYFHRMRSRLLRIGSAVKNLSN